jgi:hypothetical protein
VASLALTGCVGSTEPVTSVEPKRATLNARGTANNGPATSFFEYWLTGSTDGVVRTRFRSWPAGASGAFSETVERLAAGSSYSFRVCGRDDQAEGEEYACAQTRTFTTRPPVEDAAHGAYFHPPSTGLRIDAASGPSGERPRGSVHYSSGSSFGPFVSFDGFVTCLAVNGDRAAIGAVGREFRTGIPDSGERPATALVTIVDGRATASDTHGPHWLGTAQPGSTPPDCATASFASQQQVHPSEGGFIVDDAPAARR